MKQVIVMGIIFLLFTGNVYSQSEKKFKSTKKLNYLLYTPDGYSAKGKKTPLMLFLHGAGERGNDLEKVKKWGPPKVLENGGKIPFVVVAPQCPKGQYWDIYLLKDLLDKIVSSYNIDESRIYLTGLSMGGFGTWHLAAMFPDYFAAIAPVCGGGNKHLVKRALKEKPIWVFHGKKDKTVAESESAELVKALKEAGSDVKYTVLPEGDHAASWVYAYNEADLWNWFLTHSNEN